MTRNGVFLTDDPFWYKDAIIYEVHVKAFYDSDGNGIGDFKGLRKKLDYLEDLGVTAIWLLPFYPSPLKDDGYDIADYYNVHSQYGTLRDFKDFLRDAHHRGIRVITELVLNHTSDQHPWFQRARRAEPGSVWRNFYVWSDTPEKYLDARIIFQDFEVSNWRWDPVAKAYYWHRFYSNQPDLNFDNPRVQKEFMRVLDYWFDMGVDGLRLDAVPYLFEREGTNCENLPETYAFLAKLRGYIDGKHKDKMLLAEANQWPEDAVAYFGSGDMCHMAFHFPVMPRMFMAIQMEDRFPVIDIFDQTPTIPDACQWAIFLRNHDELTLEMVTDEERDYMYRIYASDTRARINLGIRRRLAPLLDNDRRKVELMNLLLLTLPGTPVIYYGDELGMGDNYYLGDRDGVRTPMQWSADRNAGFSSANPQKLYLPVVIDPAYHFETINVETEEHSQACLLWWMRRFIAMRKRYKAFGRGNIEFLAPDNPKVLAYTRTYENETLLVVVNLSRHPQFAELDLSKYSGSIPQEVFSRSKFLPIKDSCYMLTLGSYGYYCFELLPRPGDAVSLSGTRVLPELRIEQSWARFFESKEREYLEGGVLPAYLRGRRWFGGKARDILGVRIKDVIPVGKNGSLTYIVFVEAQYAEGAPDTYFLPLSYADGEKAEEISERSPNAVVCRISVKAKRGIIYDGLYNNDFCMALLAMIIKRQALRGEHGEIVAYAGKALRGILAKEGIQLEPQIQEVEQSNSSVLFGSELFLKTFRHSEHGRNPDLEISQFLTEWVGFAQVPAFAGGIEYRESEDVEPVAVGILQRFVPNQGSAWRFYLDVAEKYLEVVSAEKTEIPKDATASLMEVASGGVHPLFFDLIGGGPIEMSGLLGKRTAQMHASLASPDISDFAPEPFSLLYQRSLYQSMQSLTKRVFQLLRRHAGTLDGAVRDEALEVLGLEKKVLSQFKSIHQKKIRAMKTRVHGDYHLGQVFFTGKDFVIFDFEGEPARNLGERRLKRSPMRDVAGMVRSYHYAAYSALFSGPDAVKPEERRTLEVWADLWYRTLAGAFLGSYLEEIRCTGFLPEESEELDIMLKAFLLEKAIYELGYELNNRPDWVLIPLRGIKYLMEA